ncbi:MAG: ribosome recycling factor [Armatimonadetes bacterium]|nr:ribosome recycling factor [Armatimonadota bacterium]
MSLADLAKDAEHKMKKTVEATQHDFSTIRTGRATPALLDGITADYYGSPTPINQLANLSIPEPRQLLITPYDRSVLGAVEKAIKNSDININPVNTGTALRLSIPPLTEERRKEFVKVLHKKAEEGRVAVRNIRRDANDHARALVKKGEVSEDDSKRAQDSLQKLTDRYIAEIDQISRAKEAELLEV